MLAKNLRSKTQNRTFVTTAMFALVCLMTSACTTPGYNSDFMHEVQDFGFSASDSSDIESKVSRKQDKTEDLVGFQFAKPRGEINGAKKAVRSEFRDGIVAGAGLSVVENIAQGGVYLRRTVFTAPIVVLCAPIIVLTYNPLDSDTRWSWCEFFVFLWTCF